METQILLIRHGIAEDRDVFSQTGRPDSERPLTSRGKKLMKSNSVGIQFLFPKADALWTSPYQRAKSTAKMIAKQYSKLQIQETKVLTPDSHPEKVLQEIEKEKLKKVILVGHEPHLSILASFLLTNQPKPLFSIKKGGICLLKWRGTQSLQVAKLQMVAQPAFLRKIGEASNC